MPRPAPHRPSPGRLLRLYALSVMDRDGSVYGYALGRRIAQRTGGAWAPGAGAIYPALSALTGRGWARADRIGRRAVYRITPAGRRTLREVRRSFERRRRRWMDIGVLWAEIACVADPGRLLIDRLNGQIERIRDHLEEPTLDPALRQRLRRSLATVLDRHRVGLGGLSSLRARRRRDP